MLYLNWHDRFAERAAGVLSVRGGGWGGGGPASSAGTANNGGASHSSSTGSGNRNSTGPISPGAALHGAGAIGGIGKDPSKGTAGSGGKTFTSQPTTESLLGFNEKPHNVPTDEGDRPTISRDNPDWGKGPRPGTGDRWGTTLGMDPEVAKRQQDYNSAADAYQNRGLGDWLGDKAKDLIPGFRQLTPDYDNPASYSDGDYHDDWSPWGAVAGVLGMASPIPGTSLAASAAGNGIADALGASHYTFGSGGGWNSTTPASAPAQTQGPTLGGKANQGGTQIYSIADTLKQKNPVQIAVNPTPKSWENLTTIFSDGTKPKTGLMPIY
jgi:hypothetical protein